MSFPPIFTPPSFSASCKMYGGHSKLGGGGGAGRNPPAVIKRASTSLPPQPPHRSTSRLSLGGTPPSNPRNRSSTTATTTSSAALSGVEENFSLLPGHNPLAFGMMIRLAPDLVDEIRKVEDQGGTPKIKFGSMGTNPSENVIDVGGKEFRFTWSREVGDLCDIYEEQHNGEGGNGLLVESGSAWRKVNVQRVLDESTKNHVKMRSEEAEWKLKSRKAIVLDNGNPAAKSQIKQLVAVESTPWRNFKQKKEPPIKKRKVDPPQVTAASVTKSIFKPGLASTPITKVRQSSSPILSPPEQSGAPASPFGTGSNAKSQVSTEAITPILMKNKENTASIRSQKEIPTRNTAAAVAVPETRGQKGNLGVTPMDIQSLLVSLLTHNPKGMTLKGLEKAVEDTIPNSSKKIEPIIKKIANFQAPGRYFLKPGVELECFKRQAPENGSSPEDNFQQTLPLEDDCDQRITPDPGPAKKGPAVGLEERPYLDSKHEESNALEQINMQQPSPDVFGEKKISDNSEGQAGSSSDTGSDSDSESDSGDSGSDSGSHSRSRSRSRSKSPIGSGSVSSSDSDSDASSNSKEGSDEDVDIMTSDDDKEPQHKLPSAPGVSISPDPWRSVQNGTDVKQQQDGSDVIDIEGYESAPVDIEGHESGAVDVKKGVISDENETEMALNDNLLPTNEGEKTVGEAKSCTFGRDNIQERKTFIGNLFDDNENIVGDSFRHEQSDSSERKSKGKSKRRPDLKQFDEKLKHSKRLKGESLVQAPISASRDVHTSESPHQRCTEDSYKDPTAQVMNRADREGTTDFCSQMGYNQVPTGKSSSDFQNSDRRSSDHSTMSKAPDTLGGSKHSEHSGHGRRFLEKGSFVREDVPVQNERMSRDSQNEDNSAKKERKVPRNPKEGGAGGRYSAPFDPLYKQGEISGQSKDAVQVLNSQVGPSLKDIIRVDIDKYPVMSGRGLQRELSDLELGELRDPLPEEKPTKKKFERKDSFKHADNKQSSLGNLGSDLSKGKPVVKVTLDSGKPLPNLSSVVKRTPEHHMENLARPHHKVVLSHSQNLSKVDNVEGGPQASRLSDTNNRLRQTEPGAKEGNGMEGYGESLKKAPISAQQLHDPNTGVVSHAVKEGKTQASNLVAALVHGQKGTILTEANHNGRRRKRRESSFEEDNTSFSKFEKDAPEIKGLIKDFFQYKEYVKEFSDKYDSYCSFNKILEGYRNQFQKLEKELESAKGGDTNRYDKVLVQLKEAYHQCGARHKRLKKVFVVLHKELENLKQRIKDFAASYAID